MTGSPTVPFTFVGVDVGATKMAYGLVELPAGRVVTSVSEPTTRLGDGADHVDHVVRMAAGMVREAGTRSLPVGGIGVGVCELVDRRGRVRSASAVELRGDRLAAELAALHDRVVVDADVRAHAIAEARFGHGRGLADFAFVSAGTGVSSCLVIDGRPYPGARGHAIVLTSSPVTVRCTTCGAIASEIVEDVASGGAIASAWGAERAEDVFVAAARGDDRARRIVADAARALGSSIAFLANVTDPSAIVVGGGLSSAEGWFWSDVEREIRARIFSESTRGLPFLRTDLGPDAGLLGAACLPFAILGS